MIEEEYRKKYQSLPYETGVLLPQIRDIAVYRTDNLKKYENSIDTLALLLPDELREQALAFKNKKKIIEDLTYDGKKDYDNLLVYILKLLEGKGLCFPRSGFEIGHD